MTDPGTMGMPGFPARDELSGRTDTGKLRMKSHPPFNNSSRRFEDSTSSNGPSYHVAYRGVVQPERRTTKGWAAVDDAIKGTRGTGTGKVYSSLAPSSGPPAPGSMLQPLSTRYPNETRLQELLDLQRRRLGEAPGPGQYDVTGWQPTRKCFRRQAIPQLDGPFVAPLDEHGRTTRDREMEATLMPHNAGVPPGTYDAGHSKDFVCKALTAAKIGTGDRSGRTPHIKSLSVSRSIQHGIDWHVPVVVHVRPPDAEDTALPLPPREGSPRPPTTEFSQAASAASAAQKPQAGTEPADELLGPDPFDAAAAARYKARTPPLPPPTGGKVPVPPPAVARSIRAPNKTLPSDWDWKRLGHNYRTNWTMLHGGAYSHGERTTARRDVQPDAIDYLGDHTESIDPHSLPPACDEAGDMFPIPEEGMHHEMHWQSYGTTPSPLPSRGCNLSSPEPGSAASPAPAVGNIGRPPLAGASNSTPTDSTPGTAPISAQEEEPAGPCTQPGLLSAADMARREAAQAAAARAKQAAERRAAWQAKASVMV